MKNNIPKTATKLRQNGVHKFCRKKVKFAVKTNFAITAVTLVLYLKLLEHSQLSRIRHVPLSRPRPQALFGKRRYGGKTGGAGDDGSTFPLHQCQNALRSAHNQSHNPKRTALDQGATPGDEAAALAYQRANIVLCFTKTVIRIFCITGPPQPNLKPLKISIVISCAFYQHNKPPASKLE